MGEFEKFQFFDEEGRQEIYRWSELRRRKYQGFRRNIYFLRIFAFDRGLLKSFIRNINVIVIIQMILAGGLTFLCQYTGIKFDVHPTLFVSPLIFPLAFSINTDFQRREKVLEDLANFKGSAMVYFFCLRDWRESADFDENFMKAASNKLKSLLFHLREYLMTEKVSRRSFILQVIYEDCSDLAQVIERVRLSKLPNNSPLVSRLFHLLNTLCHSFERLRVVREYRSPRSIRSFTKIFIFGLPILLSPYYVYLGESNNNVWSPYFIAVLVSFVFGSLQGVQDKLDDPFDGMSEDDIDLARLDDWTVQSLEATANRTFKVGRFTVLVKDEGKVEVNHPPPGVAGAAAAIQAARGSFHRASIKSDITRAPSFHRELSRLRQKRQLSMIYSDDEESFHSDDMEMHPYAGVLSNLPGNATILRGGQVKEYRSMSSMDHLDDDDEIQLNSRNSSVYNTPTSTLHQSINSGRKQVSFDQVIFGVGEDPLITIRNSSSGRDIQPATGSVKESSVDAPVSLRSLFPGNSDHRGSLTTNNYDSTDSVLTEGQIPTNLISDFSVSSSLDHVGEVSESVVGKGVASYINANKRNIYKQGMPRNASDGDISKVAEIISRNSSVPNDLSGTNSIFVVPRSDDTPKPRFMVLKGANETAHNSNNSTTFPDFIELQRTSSTAKLMDNQTHPLELVHGSKSSPADMRKCRKKLRLQRSNGSDTSIIADQVHGSIEVIGAELKDSEVFI